jgi:hypothetical protein
MHVINRSLIFVAVAIIALAIMQNQAGAAPLVSGNLVISEVMANPSAVLDANGEWFELFNPTGSSIDLDGLVLRDDGVDFHTISGTLNIASGGYLVLGINGNSGSNGGYVADYVYSDFLLANSADEIVISEVIDEVETEIARLDYTFGFVTSGASRQLPSVTSPPFTEGDYILATTVYGDGDLGTPGAPVPEPSTVLLFASGLAALAIRRRQQH